MKLSTLSILCTASLLLLSGCISPKPSEEKKAVIDSTLPVITLTQHGIMRDMKTVAFEWSGISDPRVSAIYVYKKDFSNKDSKKLEYLTTIDNRFRTHFVDNTDKPNSRYSYAFKVISKDAEGKLSKVFTVNTLPVLQSVSWIHSIEGLPRMAKIIWRPHSSERVEKYIIERKAYDDKNFEEIATLNGRLNAEYIDSGLKDDYVYFYRVRVETFDGIVSTPSAMVKVITKALPKSITHISATKNLPRAIEIQWEKSNIKDFKRYYLYRSDTKDGNYELIAKLYNNHFRDTIKEDGKSYFYRVSVVDKDGLESRNDQYTIMGMSLPKPLAPTVLEAIVVDGKVRLTWNKNDARVTSYKIVRTYRDGWFHETTKDFNNITKTEFLDRDIKPNSTYTYTVYGVDANGIVSQPSPEVKVVTKEFDNVVDAPKDEVIEKKASQTQETISPVNDLDVNEL